MTQEQIRRILDEDSPLTVRLVSGRAIHVPHTDYAMMNPVTHSVLFIDPKGHVSHVLLESIESIELEKPAV